MAFEIPTEIIIFVCLFIAALALPMAWIAKNIWRDRAKTQIFAILGIISVIVFMILIWDYLPE
jgi:hypothetical protein